MLNLALAFFYLKCIGYASQSVVHCFQDVACVLILPEKFSNAPNANGVPLKSNTNFCLRAQQRQKALMEFLIVHRFSRLELISKAREKSTTDSSLKSAESESGKATFCHKN